MFWPLTLLTRAFQPSVWMTNLRENQDIATLASEIAALRAGLDRLEAHLSRLEGTAQHSQADRQILVNIQNLLHNKFPAVDLAIDSTRQILANIQNLLDNKFPAVDLAIDSIRKNIVSVTLHSRLTTFETIRSIKAADSSSEPAPAPLASSNLAESFGMLENRYPALFPVWKRLLDAGERAYHSNPNANLSVYGNPIATEFRAFCLPALRGTVLDIGCGPAPLPIYLDGYDIVRVAGMDPFGAPDMHPFVFANAVAESIPWADRSFDTAVIATSLDHLIDPKLGVAEIARILKPAGTALFWVWFQPNAPSFDPNLPQAGAIDEFHLYHFDRPWFLDLMSPHFDCLEELSIDGWSHFYQFHRKS
jgi:SAM-dependent methyltransferase